VKKKFEDHFNPKVNIAYERTQFNRRFQQSGVTCESFITDLLKLVDTCGYGEMKDQLLRDQISAGMSDLKLSERLQMEQNRTVEKVVERVRASEQVKHQAQEMRASSTSLEITAAVNAIWQKPTRYNSNRSRDQTSRHFRNLVHRHFRNLVVFNLIGRVINLMEMVATLLVHSRPADAAD